MANKRAYHALRKNVRLSDLQRQVILGTLLGDGCLAETFSKKNLRLQIEHGQAQRAYVLWKYRILQSLVLTPPKFQQRNRSWRFKTISHPELTALGRLFYKRRKKVVPQNLEVLLRAPISIAVWFMDDGAKNRNDGLIFNTQCFSKKETERLKKILAKNFGLDHISLQRDKNGWRLYVQKASAEKMTALMSPYILPELAYKMISPVETTRRPPIAVGVKI